ncbi:3D domain-containing protein [Ferroacidibacillus organovorans]|uniref:LysM domain-containing protein n=1 Tax=Ferroacidibacillus organovorans TaxID=1765683 RepID=A0A1V4ES45_9BACL|nr:3D domain-containing protein [Ferroacidibacillus organovorans]OAG95416.1 hypothetical protein AYW79_00450 [Ferroacidibacillus organovorans]OPG15747.1 hypothetical protein B2M26_08990 [Ferroacidibacillus organovorans]
MRRIIGWIASVAMMTQANTSLQTSQIHTHTQPTAVIVYRIQPGNTLQTIAKRFKTSVETLVKLNRINHPNLIQTGQQLQIPQTLPFAPSGTRAIVSTLTAYTDGFASTGKHPGTPSYGVTATGDTTIQGITVAVDPNVIPYGSVLYIPGVGFRIADDTGGAITGTHIDVFFRSENTALQFGRKRNQIVYVLPYSMRSMMKGILRANAHPYMHGHAYDRRIIQRTYARHKRAVTFFTSHTHPLHNHHMVLPAHSPRLFHAPNILDAADIILIQSVWRPAFLSAEHVI